jgi:hypothetical protein
VTFGPGDDKDPDGLIGSRVARAGTDRVIYLESDDVVELIERVDDYLGYGTWKIQTIDRTNNGTFYAFLALTQTL